MEAFNNSTYIQDRMDVQHTPLYDTITIAAGSAVNSLTSALFTNVGASSNKTLAQTNLSQSQKLPAPEAFSIFAFRTRWSEDILLADLLSILDGFTLEFSLGQKNYQRAPLWYFAAGGGVSGFTTRTSASVYNNGLPSREAIHKLAIPIVIENQMTFFAQLQGTAFTLAASADGGTGLNLILLLDGLFARGVQ